MERSARAGDNGDKFPTQSGGAQWYFVDLGYAKDVVSAPAGPGTTGNFTSGTWSGNVAALQAATNVILQASAGLGHSGISNPFNVQDTPKLAIATYSNSVVLSWSAAAAGFTLQQAPSLPNWANVPGTPTAVGGRYYVTNALGAGPSYFQLRKP